MKHLLSLVCLLWSVCAFAQITKTVHRTYPVEGITQVALALNAKNIEVRETKGSRVLVEMTIQVDVPNETMVQYLIDNGRYELVQTADASKGLLTLSNKKNNNALMVKGKECKEEYSYVIYLPAKIRYAADASETSSAN